MVGSSLDPPAKPSLSGLTDVTITTPISTQALIYNGTEWINAVASGTGGTAGITSWTITGATDIDDGLGSGWDSDIFNASGIKWSKANQKWEPVNIVGGAGLSDVVDDTSPQLGGDLDARILFGILDATYISTQKISSGTILHHMPSSQFRGWLDGIYQPSGTQAYMDDFYPSAMGAGLSGSYSTHRQDTTIHYPSSSIISWTNQLYAPTGAITSDVAWSGASGFYTISSNYIGHSSNKLIHSLSSNLKIWFDTIYEPLGASGTAWSGAAGYYSVSSNYYNHSSNNLIHTKIKTGWAVVSNGGTIIHNLGEKPSYVSITPSGSSCNFGINFTVDSSEITVYLTAPGSRNVNWLVEK